MSERLSGAIANAQREADADRNSCSDAGVRRLRFASSARRISREEPLLEDSERSDMSEDSIDPQNPFGAIQVNARLAQSVPVLPSMPGFERPQLRKQFSLDLMPQGGDEWRWLSNVAFIVASSFIIGSLLFIAGASVGVSPIFLGGGTPLANWSRGLLVRWAYLIGGTYFVIGAYLSWYEVINVNVPDEKRVFFAGPSSGPSQTGYYGAGLYFVGAVLFEIAVITGVAAPQLGWLTPQMGLYGEWAPQAVGGACFTIAACIETHHNHDATSEHRVWWLCRYYFYGSALFWVAATLGFLLAACDVWEESCEPLLGNGPSREELGELVETWGVNLLYWFGSVFFLAGGIVQMRMWKAQQFGLGFIREVNQIYKAFEKPIDWRQQISLVIYTTTAALSALNIALNYGWLHTIEEVRHFASLNEELLHLSQLASDFAGWIASHGMLVVATVVHQTPSIAPFDYLIWVQRLVALFLLLGALLRCMRFLQHGDEDVGTFMVTL